MAPALTYAIKFVSDMDAAVDYHSSQLGLRLRFKSPGWSEFETGQTTLALHLASNENPPGTCQLGFRVESVDAFFAEQKSAGARVVSEPADLHGQRVGKLRDPDGAVFSVSGS
jgi:lactoylglutathione lyase